MKERNRRLIIALIVFVLSASFGVYERWRSAGSDQSSGVESVQVDESTLASTMLEFLPVKGKAPKTGYERDQFSDGWGDVDGCDMRNYILKRDMREVVTVSETDCRVTRGILDDPYTNKAIQFVRGASTSDDVQVDHVVALSNAWQTGAQQISPDDRYRFANDPLNLLAVDGPTNQKKGDSDAATWLPPNTEYRCRYVARQIAVKKKYVLWVTEAEKKAIKKILDACPGQVLPIEKPSGIL